MAKVNRAQEYSDMQIRTAGKLKGLQMLHHGGVLFIKEAIADKSKRQYNVVKAQNIIAQLQMVLNFEEGDIAELLLYIYDFMYIKLNESSDRSLTEALELFEHLYMTLRLAGYRARMAA